MSKKKDEALDFIAGYIIPSFTFNGEKYVKLEVVQLLRQTARDALQPSPKKV